MNDVPFAENPVALIKTNSSSPTIPNLTVPNRNVMRTHTVDPFGLPDLSEVADVEAVNRNVALIFN